MLTSFGRHNKADCPNPRVERAPEGPCRHCGEEGHWARECKAPKKIDRSNLPDKTVEEAWALILEAVNEGELDDIKHAVQIYAKASPETTFLELEKAFREQDIKLYLICIERPLASMLTNMDLQGYTDKKYTVTYRLAWNPPRPRDREIWPKDIDENFERLADAGETVDRGKPKCHNCGEIGHISKSCPQEKREVEAPTIKCFNCDGVGHRMRDCECSPESSSRSEASNPLQALLRVLTSLPARIAARAATRLLIVGQDHPDFSDSAD